MEPIKLIPLHSGRAEVWSNGAENLSVHLTYDVSNYLKSWPDAQPSVAFERADGEKYAHAWELDGPVLHIPLLLADTETPGMCKCMITMISGDGQTNTAVFCGIVTEGVSTLGKAPSEPELGIIEQVNAAAARAEAAANSGNGGIFFVRITSEDNETYTADKTCAEICVALEAGQMAYAIIQNTYYAPLVGADESTAIFSLVASLFGQLSVASAVISADGAVTVEMT